MMAFAFSATTVIMMPVRKATSSLTWTGGIRRFPMITLSSSRLGWENPGLQENLEEIFQHQIEKPYLLIPLMFKYFQHSFKPKD